MTSISGFTFVHNALESGYPIIEAIASVSTRVDEIVIVDMQSTDGTVQCIERNLGNHTPIRFIEGEWIPGAAGECLKKAHMLHKHCDGDAIIHFEADEVYSFDAICRIIDRVNSNVTNICVWRLQIEQNFQRIRWYPEVVHRVFPNHTGVVKDGHTTTMHNNLVEDVHFEIINPDFGFLWDVTNCFRDSSVARFDKQAELWGHEPCYKYVPIHMNNVVIDMTEEEALEYLKKPHWTWTTSPFKLPGILNRLVGVTNYRDYWNG